MKIQLVYDICMDKKCEREGCASVFAVGVGRGKPKRFCSGRCQVQAWREGTKAPKEFLYAGTFIESFFQFRPGTVSGAVRRKTLQNYGVARINGRKCHVLKAEDMGLWFMSMRNVEMSFHTERLDAILQAAIARERPRKGTPQHAMRKPKSIVWISDYIHHGGKSPITTRAAAHTPPRPAARLAAEQHRRTVGEPSADRHVPGRSYGALDHPP